jgi:hypothetical protein
MPSVNLYCSKLVYLDLVFNCQLFDLIFSLIFCHLIFELPPSVAASVLEFDDNEKQKMYKTISFKEVRDEIFGLKVVVVS